MEMPDDRRTVPKKVRRPREEMYEAVESLQYAELMVVGSWRREKDTVGDLDCLVLESAWNSLAEVTHHLQTFSQYEEISGGNMKSVGIIMYKDKPLLLNLWWVPTYRAYAAMYLFSTGPYDLNIMMRAKAKGKGLTLSQYGLFNGDGSQLDHGETEEEIFALLDIPYLTPQQRENWRDHLIQQPKESAVQVKSSSGEGSYSVTIKEGKAVDCECQGFAYRSRCRHLEEAEAIYRQNSTR